MKIAIGILSILVITLLINIIIDCFILKESDEIFSFIEMLPKNKEKILVYLMINIIEIILFILMGTNIIFYLYYFVTLIFFRISIIDYKTKYIDNGLLILLSLVSFLSLAIYNNVTITGSILTGLITYILLAAFSKITKGAFGMGDAYVLALLGVIFGFQGLMSILIVSSIFAFAVSVVLIIKSRANKNKELPFTPYIFASLILMLIVNNI